MQYKLEWHILLSYLAAGILSFTILSSISPDRVFQQTLSLVIGLVIVLYFSRQNPSIYPLLGWPAYFLTIFLLLMTAILGENVRGSVRWIELSGFRFQASEFTKPLLMLAFARFLDDYPLNSFTHLFRHLLLFALPTLLIFRQPDLGTALVITAIWLAQVIVSGPDRKILLSLLFAGTILLFAAPQVLHDYQLARLVSFANPGSDPLGSGYNVLQSIIAVGSGGILGKGLGHGTQSHLRFLPERHTDFVFASLAEELGLVGSAIVLFVLSFLLIRLLQILILKIPRVQTLIVAGAFAYLCFQTFINIGMNIGLAPVTGITLPLISYGGSSVIATALTLGIISSISSSRPPDSMLEIK